MASEDPQNELEFPPDIAAAFGEYPTPPLPRDFDAQFWTKFEARRGRYRGFSGLLRRVWELEVEGVLVWRLALSMLSGGATCALFFALALGFHGLKSASVQDSPIASKPRDLPAEIPNTPRLAFNGRSFYAREWEFDWALRPKIRPRQHALPKKESGISWIGSAKPLA